LLKPFSYFHDTENAENSYIFKEICKYVTLSLSEPKTKTVFELQNVSENFSVEILSNLKFYEEHLQNISLRIS
jgi:hypothetical protein